MVTDRCLTVTPVRRLDAAVLDGITAGREAAKEGPSEAQCMGALLHDMLTRGTETPSNTPARKEAM